MQPTIHKVCLLPKIRSKIQETGYYEILQFFGPNHTRTAYTRKEHYLGYATHHTWDCTDGLSKITKKMLKTCRKLYGTFPCCRYRKDAHESFQCLSFCNDADTVTSKLFPVLLETFLKCFKESGIFMKDLYVLFIWALTEKSFLSQRSEWHNALEGKNTVLLLF